MASGSTAPDAVRTSGRGGRPGVRRHETVSAKGGGTGDGAEGSAPRVWVQNGPGSGGLSGGDAGRSGAWPTATGVRRSPAGSGKEAADATRAAGSKAWERIGRDEGTAGPPPHGAAPRQGPGDTGVPAGNSGWTGEGGAGAGADLGAQQQRSPQSIPQRQAPGAWRLGADPREAETVAPLTVTAAEAGDAPPTPNASAAASATAQSRIACAGSLGVAGRGFTGWRASTGSARPLGRKPSPDILDATHRPRQGRDGPDRDTVEFSPRTPRHADRFSARRAAGVPILGNVPWSPTARPSRFQPVVRGADTGDRVRTGEGAGRKDVGVGPV